MLYKLISPIDIRKLIWYLSIMDKKIGLFWLRDDFRIARNDGLAEATYNHDKVVVFYLYKDDDLLLDF